MGPFYIESINALKASRWELLCARLFGKKRVEWDGRFRVKMAFYRGKYYLLDYGWK